jgi:hypothetical protein
MFAGDGGFWDRQRWNATTDVLGAKLPFAPRRTKVSIGSARDDANSGLNVSNQRSAAGSCQSADCPQRLTGQLGAPNLDLESNFAVARKQTICSDQLGGRVAPGTCYAGRDD